jgi:hypothetical protein
MDEMVSTLVMAVTMIVVFTLMRSRMKHQEGKKRRRFKGKFLAIPAIPLMLVGFGAAMNAVQYEYNVLGFVGMVAGIIMLISGIVLGLRNKVAEDEESRTAAFDERRQQLEESWADGSWQLPLDDFEQKCVENKIYGIFSEYEYQKAKLIAASIVQQYNIPEEYQEQYSSREKLNEYFAAIQKRKTSRERAELAEQAKEEAAKEAKLEAKYTRYAECIGRHKSVQYCQDHLDHYQQIVYECIKDEESVRKGGEATYLLGRSKESSWATHGGIANGIAGGAAGVAVAVDVQRKNAQVQQQNAQLAQSIGQLTVMSLDRIWKEKERARDQENYWHKCREKAQILLVETPDENKLLAQLNPKVVSAETTITGAVRIKVEFQPASGLYIYENVPAVVDGSIKVVLSNGGKVVGSAICVIQYTGASAKHTVDCICTNVSVRAEKYDISFTPYHLWAVEKH